MTSPKSDDVEAFWEFFQDDIANAPVLSASELGEHSMRSHMARNDPPRPDGQHYDGCPCGACQGIRAAKPTTHAIQAKHLSGASIGKLVAWEVGRDLTTGEQQWSPTAMLDVVRHRNDDVNLEIDWGNNGDYDGWNAEEHELRPDDWVRVTQVPAEGEVAA